MDKVKAWWENATKKEKVVAVFVVVVLLGVVGGYLAQ